MSLPNFLSSGLDMADFVELSAPTPWLILATDGDYFTPAGARLVYDEARRWFGLYGAEDKLRFFVGSGPARNSARNSGGDLQVDDPLAEGRPRRFS